MSQGLLSKSITIRVSSLQKKLMNAFLLKIAVCFRRDRQMIIKFNRRRHASFFKSEPVISKIVISSSIIVFTIKLFKILAVLKYKFYTLVHVQCRKRQNCQAGISEYQLVCITRLLVRIQPSPINVVLVLCV